jgi:hypothetical protein
MSNIPLHTLRCGVLAATAIAVALIRGGVTETGDAGDGLYYRAGRIMALSVGSVATLDWRSMSSQELGGETVDARAQAANSKSLWMN